MASFLLPHFLRRPVQQQVAMLTTHMLDAKNDDYWTVVKFFEQGGSVGYDGYVYTLRGNNEIACGVFASQPANQMNEHWARKDAERSLAQFETLRSRSTDVSAIVAGKKFRVSIMVQNNKGLQEVCRVVDGRIEWRMADELQ